MTAFALGVVALAWREQLEDREAGRYASELEEKLADEGWRGFVLFSAPKLLGAAIGRNELDAADSFARWFCEELDARPLERIAVLADWVTVKRRSGEVERAEEILLELEALLEVLAADATLDPFSRDIVRQVQASASIRRSEGWAALGVLDQAIASAERAFDLSETFAERRLEATLAVANIHLVSQRFASALTVLDAYLETRPAFPGGTRRTFDLARAVALAELEREDRARDRKAAEALRAVAWTGDDLPGARAMLELADVLLRDALEAPRPRELDSALANEVEVEVQRALDSARAILARAGASPASKELGTLLATNRARFALATKPDEARLEASLQGVDRALGALLDERRRVPPRPGGIGFLHVSYRRALLAARIRLQIRLMGPVEGRLAALQGLLDVQSGGRMAQKLGVDSMTVAKLREDWLGAGHGVLLYLPERYAVHVFAFDATRLEYAELSAPVTFRVVRDRFLETLDTDPLRVQARPQAILEELREGAHSLTESLFSSPVREVVKSWDAVTIVGAELLGGLPFECLPLDVGGQLLGVTHAVEQTPSLAVSYALSRASNERPNRDLLLAATLRSARKGVAANRQEIPADQLRSVAGELEAGFDDDRRLTLLDDRASWAAIRGAASGGTSVLHVLAHGSYDRERERGACLVLAPDAERPDGLVYSEDIERASIRAEVVILSACGTARGPARLGADNLQHLGGAFLQAGASCVVLTAADVTLDAAVTIAGAMQRELAGGATPAQALRGARASVTREEGPLAAFLAGRVQLLGSGARALGQR